MARRSWLNGLAAMRLAVCAATALLVGMAVAADEPPTIPEGTHKQVKIIAPTGGDATLKLTAFCLNKDGNVIALVNRIEAPKPIQAKPAQAKPRIRLQLRAAPKAEKKAIEKKPADDNAADTNAADSGTQKKTIAAKGALVRSRFVAAAQRATKTEVADGEQIAQADTAVAAEAEVAETPASKAGAAEVRILDADGKMLGQWPVEFEAQAINVDADGNIVVAGDGFIARYDLKGKELAKAESPQVAGMPKNQKELENRARESLKGQAASLEEALKTIEKQKADLADKKDEDLTDEEKLQKARADVMINAYKKAMENYTSPKEAQVKMMANQLAGRARKVNAIAANGKYLFVTCGDPKGFGYSVWRTDMDFQNPKQIVSGLSGCCGQMDVQCCGDELVVAENSRKRVVRYDAEGKKVASFGKASRDGAGETFGSCCNPMNTRLHDGKLLVSDSDGRVRLFSLDGKYEGEVGKADVRAGCKSSTVDISPDGNRVYYIDVNTSQICVLDRKPADDKQAAVQ